MTPLAGSTGDVSEEKLYECTNCLEHHTSTERVVTCPDCGGTAVNLSKERAE